MGPDTARRLPAQNRQPSFDRWLRFDRRTALSYEKDGRDARITHLRTTIFFGIIVYNLYIISNVLLMPDMVAESVFIRLLIATPAFFAIARLISCLSVSVRENLLVAGLLGTHALPLWLFRETQSDLGAYTFGEVALTVVYGNMLLALRFPQAVLFTTCALVMTLTAVAMKSGLPLELQFGFALQFSVACVFSLYANYIVERRRCEDYTKALSSTLRAERAERSKEVHREMSKTDALTNLPNRRHLDEQLTTWFLPNQCIAILMIDIDHFKLFNDGLGHPAGDDCLRQIANVFKGLSHSPDIFCARFGGEEFTIVMNNTTELAAARMAQNTVDGIAALRITHPGRHDGIDIVTASVGVAYRPQGSDALPKDVLSQADHALYKAKQVGRNRFVIADHASTKTNAKTGT